MIFRNFLCFVFLLGASQLMFSQPGSSGGFGNTIPQFCNCVTFKYACTDKTVEFFSGGVTSKCNHSLVSSPAVFKPFELRDSSYCRRNCPARSEEGICLVFGNWHICDFNGCDARIYQTLSNFPTINGQLIGSGAGVGSTGGVGTCIGPIYAGPLNNINSTTKLNVCPGDEAVLTLPQLDIPEDSGLCLEVSIKDLSNQTIVDNIYTHQDVSFATLDITNLLAALDPSTIYRLEMTLRCCSDVQTCTNNTFKSAYIELSGSLSFQAVLNQGGGGSKCDFFGAFPSTQFPGPSFITPLEIDLSDPEDPIKRNCPVNLVLNNVNNPDNKDMDITLFRLQECDPEGLQQILFTTNIVPGSPQSPALIPLVSNKISSTCECYKLLLEYEGCDSEPVEEIYYFRVGDDCPPNLNDEDDSLLKKSNNDVISTRPNPVINELIIDIVDIPEVMSSHFDLLIYDMSGRQVHISQVPAVLGSISVPLDIHPGTYLYVLSGKDQVYRGKFIKQ